MLYKTKLLNHSCPFGFEPSRFCFSHLLFSSTILRHSFQTESTILISVKTHDSSASNFLFKRIALTCPLKALPHCLLQAFDIQERKFPWVTNLLPLLPSNSFQIWSRFKADKCDLRSQCWDWSEDGRQRRKQDRRKHPTCKNMFYPLLYSPKGSNKLYIN